MVLIDKGLFSIKHLYEQGAQEKKQKARAVYPALAFLLIVREKVSEIIQVFMENRTKEEAKEDQGMKRILKS